MKYYLLDFIHRIQSQGRYTFTLTELKKSMNVSDNALKGALYRLSKKNRIYSVYRGFYVIIPPEYSGMGILPASLFINDLMSYIQKPYYVGLLSAAAMHGSSHQQPQEYFVVTQKPSHRTIHAKGVTINFHIKSSLPSIGIVEKKTDTGFITISGLELTALDLFFYEKRIGSLERAVTVLSDIIDLVDVQTLGEIAEQHFPTTCIQRCGYVLDSVLEFKKAADVLFNAIHQRKTFRVPLSSSSIKKGYPSNNRWKVIVNTTLDIEI